jgi:hypothetical protein
MEYSEEEKAKVRQHIANWKVVSEVMDKLKAAELQPLTDEQSAEWFNGLECDPSLIWIPDEKLYSSGLVEQQRIFARGHRNASNSRRGA